MKIKIKIKKVLKVLGYIAGISVLALLVSDPAMAQGLDKITAPIKAQLPGVSDVLSAVAYVSGIGFGIKGALKLKEHNESKGQVPLSAPITLFIVAGMLLALPTMLSISTEAVFGGGNTKTTLNGQATRTIK